MENVLSKNIFVDCSLESVKNSSELYNQTSSYNYADYFYSCKDVKIPTTYCLLNKNYVAVRSYCFPQSCDGLKIKQFIENIYHDDNETKYELHCKNIVDPTILIIAVGTFLALIALTTFISTIISKNPPKFFKSLPSKIQEYFQFFSVFSLSENLKTLLNTKSSSSSIGCLNGLKALSLVPIVFIHSLQAAWPSPDRRFYVPLLYVTGILPTDTFFVVSGILCAKFYIARGNLFSKFFKILFERYMRLTPSGIIVISIYLALKVFLVPITSSDLSNSFLDNCKKTWWVMLVYLQNYYNEEHVCFVTFWFATVLFQLYFFTPFILVIIEKLKSCYGKIFMVSALVLTFLPGFATGLFNQSFYNFLYSETLSRSYPYLVGLFYYWLTSDSVKLVTSTQTKLAWTATSLSFILALTPCFSEAFNEEMLTIFYIPVRILWPFALCWIIHACHNGFGGLINKILSAKLLIPFSNLSLGIYLINVIIAQFLQFAFQFLPSVESYLIKLIYFTVFNWIITVFCAILLYLYIEVPFHRMSRMRFEKTKDSPTVNGV